MMMIWKVGFLFFFMKIIAFWGEQCVLTKQSVCVFVQLKESPQLLLQESMHQKPIGHMWF